jgi:2-polyprenyl-3-methyl-5-hydroxy-6-metoxy-1,4-benzoquinol methylase
VSEYDARYYAYYLPEPRAWNVRYWFTFWGHIADCIIDSFEPSTALDVGCALGMLTGALRARKVDAYGIDISEYAIGQAPKWLRPFLSLRAATEPIEARYDLITCIEVLEHLGTEDARLAITNICQATNLVLFSSTPDDHDEPTHCNVQPPEYWRAEFAKHGFKPCDKDVSFISSQAEAFYRG